VRRLLLLFLRGQSSQGNYSKGDFLINGVMQKGFIEPLLTTTTADFLVDNRDDSLYHPWHPGA
jgi:hypothetical protein